MRISQYCKCGHWLLSTSLRMFFESAVYIHSILWIWRHLSSLMPLESLFWRKTIRQSTTHDGFNPRNNSVEYLVFSWFFLPTPSDREWLIILWNVFCVASYCWGYNLQFLRRARTDRLTFKNIRFTVPLDDGQYAVVKWCLMCIFVVNFSFNNTIKCKLWSATNQFVPPKWFIHCV